MIVQRIRASSTYTGLVKVDYEWPDFTPSLGRRTYVMAAGEKQPIHQAHETIREQRHHARGPVMLHLPIEQFL